MSLNLGTLTGFLDLDVSAFDSKLGGAMDKLREHGSKGAMLAGAAGAAIATALVGAVVGGMNVEAANDKLAAQLALTGPESERLGKVAGSLYANAYGGSLGEVNTAVGAVMSSIKGMRSASSADIEAMSIKVLDLAAGFEVDVTRAAQVAGQMISSGLAKDGAQAMDLLTAAMQKVPAAVREDILDAVDEYGPFMTSLGLQGEQAFGLLVTAAEKGAFGIDKTGDALKEFTIRATDMSAASKVGFDALGMSQEEMARKLLAGGDTAARAFDEIVDGLVKIKDPAAQSQAALALFGTPLEDLNASEIPAFLTSLDSASSAMADSAGAAERFGATLNDNASASLTSLRRQVEQTVIGLANGMLPTVNDAAAAMAVGFGPALDVATDAVVNMYDAVVAASDFLAEHETTTKVLAATIVTLMLPTLVSLAVGYATTAAAAVAGAAVQTAAWLSTQVRALATGVILAATFALTVAGWVSSAAAATAGAIAIAAAWLVALGPVGLVIAAVAAVVGIFVTAYKTSETFRNVVTAAMEVAKRGIGDAVGFMIQGFRGLLTVWLTVADGIISGAAAALGWIPGLGGKLKAANRAFDNMRDGILATLDSAAQRAHGFGEATGQGLANGLAVSRSAAVREAQITAESVATVMRKGLQVASPSKLTTYYGEMLGAGLVDGMRSQVGAVASASSLLSTAAVPGMDLPVAMPAGMRARGGDGSYAPTVTVTAPDQSALLAELRRTREASERLAEEFRVQADRQIHYAYTELDRVPA